MASRFVNSLAARALDPEALAAWIGRKKHGKAAFQQLAAAGRAKSENPSALPAPSEPPDPEAGARARLREAQRTHEETRANRPAAVEQAMQEINDAARRYGSGLGGGNINRLSDDRFSRLRRMTTTLALQDPAMFNREEARTLANFQHRLIAEERRRARSA